MGFATRYRSVKHPFKVVGGNRPEIILPTSETLAPELVAPELLTPELRHLYSLLNFSSPVLRHKELARVTHPATKNQYPLYSLTLGSENDGDPVLVFVGGVHGVERIGSQVVLAFLETLIQRLQWDQSLIDGLAHLRLVFIPILNPIGLLQHTRANGRGVDLMRNAPIDAVGEAPFLASGHYFSSWLPWYRGSRAEMEVEAQALCDCVLQELERSPFVMALDVHSGFGFYDRLWFPFACSREPVPALADFYALQELLFRTYPHLDYVFEPQSHHYITHGDLWDWLYLRAAHQNRLLMPVTLEMGSWRWVRKNPLQLRQLEGLYHPVKPHRLQRVLRRHTVLMEFLIRATRGYSRWVPAGEERVYTQRAALRRWYERYGYD
jgi:hypothetical protein